MAARQNVTASRLTECVLKGKDIQALTRTVTIRESICSPFIQAEILVLDNSNHIVNMKLMGGDRCDISFDAINGPSYTIDLYVLDVKAVNSPENMELKIYTISLVTSEYFTDQGARTPETTTVQQTGCETVRKIWTQLAQFKTPLSQPTQDGPVQDGNQPLQIGLMKPFTAIGQVRDIQVYTQYPTGNVLLYRDAKNVVHVPLQYIYENCLSGTELVQKYTWGYKIEHMFIGGETDRAIISVTNNSRTTMLDPDEFRPTDQNKRADDISFGKMGANIFDKVAAGLKGAAMAMTNYDKTSTPIDHTTIMDNARCYAHCLKAQVQYLVKIPIQSGINITVGQGVDLTLAPSYGELLHPHSGLYLVTDLIHEVNNDLREVNGTTTLQCLRTGANCGV